ncbi:heme peroxidase [Rhizodiscina lignyota]|uniref:Peroxidase n=1 Tax=Rhizodiscina lignyota TaxID=1504668 RepID=A0A9P4I342_9PEZI|nr:heme peroxidase [Rhizodiscina lignyota]
MRSIVDFIPSFLLPVAFFAFLPFVRASLHYPDPLTSRLEHILVDTDGAFRSGFKDAITPCDNYVSGSQLLGRETSGQWLRVAFHDFVTARVVNGTGGIDASIGFETLRAEDTGSAFNDSFAFWRPYVDAHTSMADLVAVSVVTVLNNCGGLQVPLRGGRVDATEAGAFGVPEPETSLKDTLAEFANAGFNAADSIGLTACGHSIGRVHHGGFAQVVPESAVTPNNTGGGINFDATRGTFDIDVVLEYLGGYGQRGGPLVTTDNVTVRSDLRLYESDGNKTMKTLGQSKDYFFTTCRGLFQRMIETVPKEVALSDVVKPITVKPVNVSFDLNSNGDVVLAGSIRELSMTSSPSSATIDLLTSHVVASTTAKSIGQTGSSIFGTTTYFPFSITLSRPGSSLPTALQVTFTGQRSSKFSIEPRLFYSSSLSSASIIDAPPAGSNDTSATAQFNISAVAAEIMSDVEAIVNVPTPQQGTLAPKMVAHAVRLSKNEYIYSGNVKLNVDTTLLAGVTVDIVGTGKSGKITDSYNRVTIDARA